MPRAVWKGAISFGLVYIPVELHPASQESTLRLHLLDKRDFSPVGYRRINKETGKEVEWQDIVKGYEYEKGRYVALSEAGAGARTAGGAESAAMPAPHPLRTRRRAAPSAAHRKRA